MHRTGYLLTGVGALLATLGACSSDPAQNSTPEDGQGLASDGAAGASSTVTGGSSTTSGASTEAVTSSTGTSGEGSGGTSSGGSSSLDASSTTDASAAVTSGMGGATTGDTSTTGLAAGGTGTASAGAGGMQGADGTQGAGGTSSVGGSAGAGGTGIVFPEGCEVSTPVSFTNDIQPFLGTSCGKGVDSGCHVTDGDSTMGSMCPDGSNNCGFTHAYDWITAGAHASSCPETPTPKRFEVVLDVIAGGNPTSCSDSRIMPPPGMGTPLTECEIAALAAWLAEPRVVQTHRADDSSPEEPYEMPPFN